MKDLKFLASNENKDRNSKDIYSAFYNIQNRVEERLGNLLDVEFAQANDWKQLEGVDIDLERVEEKIIELKNVGLTFDEFKEKSLEIIKPLKDKCEKVIAKNNGPREHNNRIANGLNRLFNLIHINEYYSYSVLKNRRTYKTEWKTKFTETSEKIRELIPSSNDKSILNLLKRSEERLEDARNEVTNNKKLKDDVLNSKIQNAKEIAIAKAVEETEKLVKLKGEGFDVIKEIREANTETEINNILNKLS